MLRETTNDLDGEHTILKYFVIESYEEGSDIFCLGEMAVEALFKVRENDLADKRIYISHDRAVSHEKGLESSEYQRACKTRLTWVCDPDD